MLFLFKLININTIKKKMSIRAKFPALKYHNGNSLFFFALSTTWSFEVFFFYATIYFQVNGGQTLLLSNWASNHAQVVADDSGGRGKQFLTALWTC